MKATYVSAFATKHVCRDLETLKRRSNLSVFQSQFFNIAKLVVETVHTATFGRRVYDIYGAKTSDLDRQILSSVIVTADQTERTIHLRDAMNVVDKLNLLRDGGGSTLSNNGSGIAMTLAPGPMELELISLTNGCMQCSGKGYWWYFCETPNDWKEGDPIEKTELGKSKRKG
jgi:hypothetical protein